MTAEARLWTLLWCNNPNYSQGQGTPRVPEGARAAPRTHTSAALQDPAINQAPETIPCQTLPKCHHPSSPAPEKITAFTLSSEGSSARLALKMKRWTAAAAKNDTEEVGKWQLLQGLSRRNVFSWSSPQLQWPRAPHFTEGTLLSDCWAGTEPCFSAVCLELKQKEAICALLAERLAVAAVCWGGEEDAGTEHRGCLALHCLSMWPLSGSSNTPCPCKGRNKPKSLLWKLQGCADCSQE